MNEILDFIERRFYKDCNWISGNCYYFSVILKDRFKNGTIVYDVINGHFLFKHDSIYYDWTGIVDCNDTILVDWDNFDDYDKLQKELIIKDCIL